MKISKTIDDIIKIDDLAEKLSTDEEFLTIVDVVIEDSRFPIWWGGLRGQHHDFDGGLARHTREVIELCFDTKARLSLDKIDSKELFLSALFHDAGKMYDYQKNSRYGNVYYDERTDEELIDTEPKFIASTHKRLIHHISRSALIWSHAVTNTSYYDKYHDVVLHNILSHHGQRTFGSPVAPKTQAAWLLHLCDGISARMNDCDRLDLVHGKPKDAQ
jgi:3'-5' exoribonuclease